jgi:glycosyltransferase involved in cell wall biosynthesis
VKIALVHDYLCVVGGSDRVFQYMCEGIPEADVYTLSLNRRTVIPYFANRPDVRTTWLNPFVQSAGAFRLAFPIATYVMQRLDLSQYDLVVSSAATVARYVRAPNGRHVCYCYIPTRAIWHFDRYFSGGVAAHAFKMLLPWLKRRELEAVAHTDDFIAISRVTQEFIREYYGRPSEVLPCPIDLSTFAPREDKSDAFLIVSRLEHWKRVDYAVEAFTRCGLPLRVIGEGPELERLRAMAGPNVTFLGGVDDATLAREYARARAVIFTPKMEYGLIPLEATASGTPVIALGKGGIREIMVPAGESSSSEAPTAVFFYEQTPEAVIDAVHRFENVQFSSALLVQHAQAWSIPRFQSRLRKMLGLPPLKTASVNRPSTAA